MNSYLLKKITDTYLDSKFLDWYYKLLFEAIAIRGGYIEYREYLKYLPINEIDFTNSGEKAQHDKLANLAQKMVDMNKAKRIEQKRLVNWVQDQLHILPDKKGNTGIAALSGKATIEDYSGDYQKGEDAADFADILKVLQKNRSKG